MPEPLDLREQEVRIVTGDGATALTTYTPTLGFTPYVLLYCEELDPLGNSVFTMLVGGGLDITDLPSLLGSLRDSLIADAAAEGVDLDTESTGVTG